jgi:TolB-like protein/Tfp pilus assembly protein PilF
MQAFLSFVVEGTLADRFRSEELKETVIGAAVFGREAAYDPKIDPVVRVEARRLRAKLQEYYSGAGQFDPVRIDLPKGSYVPSWEWQQGEGQREEQSPVDEDAKTQANPGRTLRVRWLTILISVAVTAIAIPGIRYLRRPDPVVKTATRIRSLAILPFRNLSADASKDFIAAGLTDELTTELAKAGNLRVISRTSADRYNNANKSLPQIARELNVDAVLEGTLVSSGRSMRVSAQLIRATDDTHLWAESYERDGDDFFTLENEIADSIAQHIGVALMSSRDPLTEHPSTGKAYEAYLRGRFFWNKRTLDGLKRSLDYFKQAILYDPNFGKAYAALGDSYVLCSSYGGPGPTESLLKARDAAEQALRLDPNLAEAHTVLAAVKVDYDHDSDGATDEFRRAISASPGYPTAHHWFSLHLARLGRHKEAEAEIQRALELDPLSLIINADAGDVYYYSGKPEVALAHLNRALELDANFAETHLVFGKVYELQRDFGRALSEYETADRMFGGAPNVWALKGHALAALGKKSAAISMAKRMEEAAGQRYVSGVDIAMVYCAVGDPNAAMRHLQIAYTNRDKGLDILGTDPLFDGCRSDARFGRLVKSLDEHH